MTQSYQTRAQSTIQSITRSRSRGIIRWGEEQKHKYFCRELTYLHFYFIFSYAHKCALSTARVDFYTFCLSVLKPASPVFSFGRDCRLVTFLPISSDLQQTNGERVTFGGFSLSEESELTSGRRCGLSIRLFLLVSTDVCCSWNSIKVRNPGWLVFCVELLSDGL